MGYYDNMLAADASIYAKLGAMHFQREKMIFKYYYSTYAARLLLYILELEHFEQKWRYFISFTSKQLRKSK